MRFTEMIQIHINIWIILSSSIMNKSSDLSPIENEYIQTLNTREQKAYEIAKSHLGMSFNLKKSNGYVKWLETRPKPTATHSS